MSDQRFRRGSIKRSSSRGEKLDKGFILAVTRFDASECNNATGARGVGYSMFFCFQEAREAEDARFLSCSTSSMKFKFRKEAIGRIVYQYHIPGTR